MNGSGWQRFLDYGARVGMGPAVFLLILANVAIFMIQVFAAPFGNVARNLVFVAREAILGGQVWQFVTYMFLHGGFTHLFFNMLGIWLFGSRLEHLWGTRTFLWYYFVSGVGGAVLHGVLQLTGVIDPGGFMLGASGALYGLLLAFGLAFPNATIFVFFVPMPARFAVIVFGLLAILGFGGQGIAHMTHLGGMLTGFLYLWIFTDGHISRPPRAPGGRGRGGYRSVGGQQAPRGGGTGHGHGPGGYRTGGSPAPRSTLGRLRQAFLRWRTRARLKVVGDDDRKPGGGAARPGNGRPLSRSDRERVDEILEKISREGLKSLTAEEQDILRRASRKD